MDLVSVIIPVYNVEEYLEECVNSVVKQSYKDIEIILIDDGATDRSGQICDELSKRDQRIKVYHRKNEGVSATRNYGLDIASGEWIFFVDSDDIIHSRTIEYAMSHVEMDDDICFIGFKEIFDAPEGPEEKYEKVEAYIKKLKKEDLKDLQFRIFNRDRRAICNKNIIKASSPWKIFRKDLISKNNIRFKEDLVNGEDGVFNLYAYRYARHAIAIELPLYYYRQRGDSVTNKYTKNVEKDFSKLHQAYREFILSDNESDEFKDLWDERLIWSLSFCCILKYCHPDNPDGYLIRKKQFLETLDKEYKREVQRVRLDNFVLQKKIIFGAMKERMFWLIDILCKLNNKKK